MVQNLDDEAAFLAITARLREIIKQEDEVDFIDCIQQISPKWDMAIIGVLRAYYQNRIESFEWVMYVLSRYRGFEELAANFFIAHYQIERKVFPQD